MPSLTLKKVPEDLLDRLRLLAERERRSLNQQTILLLERALETDRPSLLQAHEQFVAKYGHPPFEDDFFDGLRSKETGRMVTLEAD